MLGQVGPTPYDLYFPVGRIPVRVTPWFWLAALFTGYATLQMNPPRPDLLMVWIACLFVSILIHELGHAVAGLAFGWPSRVFLYHFGGVAQFAYQPGWTTGRAVTLSFAGPWAGFLLYGVVCAVEWGLVEYTDVLTINPLVDRWPTRAMFAIDQLKWINLWWGLVNLLPVLPLDGGHIALVLLEKYRYRDGRAWAYKLGVGVGAAAAVYFFSQEYRFAGFLFAMLAIDNFQRMDMERRGGW